MNNLDMKNIIVLKDLPSNIIDEAIVILKNNKVKKREVTYDEPMIYRDTNIIEEAQNVISEYINRIEQPKKDRQEQNKLLIKYKKLQIFSILLSAMMIISFLIELV